MKNKMIRSAVLAAFLSLPLTASAMPEGMSLALSEAKQEYLKYSEKDADEIFDHRYDESDAGFLAQLGLGELFVAAVESSEDTVEYQLQTVKDLAWTFKKVQLDALREAAKEAGEQFNDDRAAVKRDVELIELALKFKDSKLKEAELKELLSKKLARASSES